MSSDSEWYCPNGCKPWPGLLHAMDCPEGRLSIDEARIAALERIQAMVEMELRAYKCSSCRRHGLPDTELDRQPAHRDIPGGISVCLYDAELAEKKRMAALLRVDRSMAEKT